MALQGTLDTFALADVLRLLSATGKTGRLVVRGDRDAGGIWLEAGAVAGAESEREPAGDPASVLLGLLRCDDGEFRFESGEQATDVAARETEPLAVEPLLAEAEQLLAEWRTIEQVVPSLDAGLALRGELPEARIEIDAATWRVVATIARGARVRDVAEALQLRELDALRAARDLVERGLAEIVVPPTAADPLGPPAPAVAAHLGPDVDPVAEPAGEASVEPGDAAGHPGWSSRLGPEPPAPASWPAAVDAPTGPEPRERERDEEPAWAAGDVDLTAPVGDVDLTAPVGDVAPGPDPRVEGGWAEAPTLASLGLSGEPDAVEGPPPRPFRFEDHGADEPAVTGAWGDQGEGTWEEPDPDDAAQIAHHLANLSPRAAKAVAAAARATTDEEREAALAAIEAEDHTVDRSLLLRFLGSVDS